jgi:hypothetical protein
LAPAAPTARYIEGAKRTLVRAELPADVTVQLTPSSLKTALAPWPSGTCPTATNRVPNTTLFRFSANNEGIGVHAMASELVTTVPASPTAT